VAQPVGIEPTQMLLESFSPILGTWDCDKTIAWHSQSASLFFTNQPARLEDGVPSGNRDRVEPQAKVSEGVAEEHPLPS